VASNSFGTLFRITTWGESHGVATGVVIDGCPAGLALELADIQKKLDQRRPGVTPYTSQRAEKDEVQILSGVFDGLTTGAPISLFIPNRDVESAPYEATKDIFAPSSPKFTWLEKYGIFDNFGNGRASARETAARVAAGAIALKILELHEIKIVAYLHSLGPFETMCLPTKDGSLTSLFCLSDDDEAHVLEILSACEKEQDSIGGSVAIWAFGVPPGLGDPVFEKIPSRLAAGMMTIPGARAFEFGEGVRASTMKGSAHNDSFQFMEGAISPRTNHSGGAFGGITNGQPLRMKVHFKPTATINREQETVTREGGEALYRPCSPERHDRAIALRAPAVCEAMCALTLVDSLLLAKASKISCFFASQSAMKD
jgi:chorismate synthase